MFIQNIKTQTQKGFTLIELMISVAIVGILSAIALPAYNDYTVRAQVSETLILADGAKPQVLEFYQDSGQFPLDNADANYGGATGNYVSGVEIGNGSIIATVGNNANSAITGKRLILRPDTGAVGNTVNWECTSNIEAKYLPKNCAYNSR